MWAAFINEIVGGNAKGFHCVTPIEAAEQHAILTAALIAGKTGTVSNVIYSK